MADKRKEECEKFVGCSPPARIYHSYPAGQILSEAVTLMCEHVRTEDRKEGSLNSRLAFKTEKHIPQNRKQQ